MDQSIVSLQYHCRPIEAIGFKVMGFQDGRCWVEEWRGSLNQFLYDNDDGLTEEEVVACCMAVAEGGKYQFDGGPYRLVCLTPAEG